MVSVESLLHRKAKYLGVGLHLGSRRHAWPCSLCAVLLGQVVMLVATRVVGCMVVVAGGAEVLGKAVLGSSAVMLGGAVAEPDGAVFGCAAGTRTGAGAVGSSVEVVGATEVVSGSVMGAAVVDSSLEVYGAADVDSGAVVGGAVVGSSLMVLGAAEIDSNSVVGGAVLGSSVVGGGSVGSAVVVLGGAVVGSLIVVLGRAVAGCSVGELGDAVEGSAVVELGASGEGSPVVVLGGGIAGASVGVSVLLVVGVTMLGGSMEVGLGTSVELELGGSVDVRDAVVLIGGGGLQGKGCFSETKGVSRVGLRWRGGVQCIKKPAPASVAELAECCQGSLIVRAEQHHQAQSAHLGGEGRLSGGGGLGLHSQHSIYRTAQCTKPCVVL